MTTRPKFVKKQPHEYFKRKSSDWNIRDFLKECSLESYQKKIEEYNLSLKSIIDSEKGKKREQAQKLLNNYNQGTRPDRKIAREWEEEHSRKQVHIHQPTFTEIACGGTVYGGANSGTIRITNDSISVASKKEKEPEEEPLLMRALRKRKSINNSELEDVEKYKRVKSTQSTSDKEDIYDEEADEIETESNLIDLTNFDVNYHSLDPQKMWTLKSGRVVEKVIYEYARNLTHESYLHSFIINNSDSAAKSLFSEEEWKEITTSEVKAKPKLKHSLVELMKKCTVDDVKMLRKILSESFLPDEGDFDLDFVNYAYQGMLFLWRKKENPFDSSKLEGWYAINVWGRLIDPAFENLDIDLIRGEGMSLASSNRKNHERTINDRKKIGRKGDGVFRLSKDRLEFGAIEAKRKWEGENGTGYLKDSLKLNKMLKDMLNQLVIVCNMREDFARKLQVVGMLLGKNRIQVITADLPKGYVTRIQRRKIHEVAGRLTKFKPLAFVLKEILYAKSIIMQTLDIIYKKNDVDIENDLYDSDEQGEYCMPPTIGISKTIVTPRSSELESRL
ncbi:11535_t:CDS:2 [Diversispora eburnea]|uniref:11535_t:CDS:1 n=1 Tax=Diversispora eburnea TaxID=1213867 RepID=A0A9N8ZNN5_9GLOM|nr:11535_t:CDS:2 [Diversispora eburnea]